MKREHEKSQSGRNRIVIDLSKPMPASNDCLPHAAMNLGAARGAGIHSMPGMVSRLVIQEQFGAWRLYRLDKDGGFVGDSFHGTKQDALHQVKREFDITVPER
jgi:hypothetical protein